MNKTNYLLFLFVFIIIILIFILYNVYKKYNNKDKIRIGILLNYPFLEVYKDELIIVENKSKDYIKNIPTYHLVNYDNKKYGYPYDLVIGYYIKHVRPDIEVDFITPNELTNERLDKNLINFIIIFDLIEALNIDSMIFDKQLSFGKTIYENYKNILDKATNVYPPKEYQKYFYSKSNYYNHLKSNNIPITQFSNISTKNKTKFLNEIIKYAKKMKFDPFITKPDSGQEAINFILWKKVDKPKKDKFYKKSYTNVKELRRKLKKYYENVKIYKKVVIQKYIPGFDNEFDSNNMKKITSEIKSFYVGDKYAYSILTDKFCHRQPRIENKSVKFIDCQQECKKNKKCDDPCSFITKSQQCIGPDINPTELNRVKLLDKFVLRALPKIKLNDVELPRLLTRIDKAFIAPYYSKKKRELFVNEIEFVPSLFVDIINYDMIEALGNQIANIVDIYYENN